MTRATLRLAVSGLALVLTTVGCGPDSGRVGSASDVVAPKQSGQLAARAQKALASDDVDGALRYAEAAVAADPRNPDDRALLAQVYTAQGRFASAERSWMDAIELGQVNARSVLGAALSMTAQDKVGQARALVDAHRDVVPASDYGLALALMGDSSSAVDVLADTVRQDGGDARSRQNLALAYALDGRWREARLMAAQDLPAPAVETRINDWAQMARPGAYQLRVATLLGVTPRADAGQPAALALSPSSSETSVAAAEPVRDPVAIASADAQPLPAVGPAPLAPEAVEPFAAASQPVAPPVQLAAARVSEPQPQSVTREAEVAPAPARAVTAPIRIVPQSAPARAGGSHVVQLGAFSTMELARSAWSTFTRRFGALAAYSPATVPIAIKGRSLTRLAATGGLDRQSANALCRQLRGHGGQCFVRPAASGAVQQAWANQAGGQRLARR